MLSIQLFYAFRFPQISFHDRFYEDFQICSHEINYSGLLELFLPQISLVSWILENVILKYFCM